MRGGDHQGGGMQPYELLCCGGGVRTPVLLEVHGAVPELLLWGGKQQVGGGEERAEERKRDRG